MKVLRFADVISNGLVKGKRVFIRADLNVPQDGRAAPTGEELDEQARAQHVSGIAPR